MNISVLIVTPGLKASFYEELDDCINQLKSVVPGKRVISATLFLNASDNGEYDTYKKVACGLLTEHVKGITPLNYICQPPANGDHVAFEIHLINDQSYTLDRVEHNGLNYIRAFSGKSLKGIFASGLHCSYSEGVRLSYDTVLASMTEILNREGLSFNHVVRQWNYIEEIVTETKIDGVVKQHYQVFNDIRSKYYGKVDFDNGYPAATGIGCVSGGVTISFYALTELSGAKVIPVDNPDQQPAYLYPDQVLVGGYSAEYNYKTTPKFVRAKHVKMDSGHITFISGTASIRREKTVAPDSMYEQLLVTIENMESLISDNNLKNCGVVDSRGEKISYYRAYVKDTSCIDEITRKCEELLPGIPNLLLVSDICRKGLLIEIEAFAS
ncbi:MAG: hypothetical protein GY790_12650 [Bacteroidetes bacterium]|nr:hypothetical protein [Bacteroidota bacterium]